MDWHRFLLSLVPLWPAVAVWWVICFPMLAFKAFELRRSDWLELPLFIRFLLWFVEHAPVYKKIVAFGRVMTLMDDETREERRRNHVPPCPVCQWIPAKVLEIDHALDHFPGEWEAQEHLWWTPPKTADLGVLEAWLANRGMDQDVDPHSNSSAEDTLNANWCKPGECERGCEGFCDKAWDALVARQSAAPDA